MPALPSMGRIIQQDLQHEAATTQKLLDRLPKERWDWKPHPKSMSLGQLASHIATIPELAEPLLTAPELVFGGDYRPWIASDPAEVTQRFQQSVRNACSRLEKSDDEFLAELWSLKAGGQIIFSQPRHGVARGMILHHLIHHRGQLAVYLRLLDIPVPSIYGPSADEP